MGLNIYLERALPPENNSIQAERQFEEFKSFSDELKDLMFKSNRHKRKALKKIGCIIDNNRDTSSDVFNNAVLVDKHLRHSMKNNEKMLSVIKAKLYELMDLYYKSLDN